MNIEENNLISEYSNKPVIVVCVGYDIEFGGSLFPVARLLMILL